MRRALFAVLLVASTARAGEQPVIPAARGGNRLDPDVATAATDDRVRDGRNKREVGKPALLVGFPAEGRVA